VIICISLVVHIGETHIQGVFGQEGAGSQRYLNVRRMRNGSANSQQQALALGIDHQVSSDVNDLQEQENQTLERGRWEFFTILLN